MVFAAALFLTGCDAIQQDQTGQLEQYPNEAVEQQAAAEEEYLARQNLDLQAVGGLLERADNAEEFEYLLNNEGVNNLDLNGDGYADYISVAEFGNGYDDERGLSLFSQFGPDMIQEIATIFFDRDRYDAPGARILLEGNEQLYGDDYYYEANWLDRGLAIVSSLFGDRNDAYRSPYYYNNYPDDYELYPVVETPVYRTRVVEYYPEAVFVQTAAPQITEIRIRSPYDGRYVSRSELPRLYEERTKFKEKNPNRPEIVPVRKGHTDEVPVRRGHTNEVPVRKGHSDDADPRPKGNPNKIDRPKGNPNKADRPKGNSRKADRPSGNPNKADRPKGNPNKADRPKGNPNKADRPAKMNADKPGRGGNDAVRGSQKPNNAAKSSAKPQKADNPGKQKAGGNGGGKGNGGGGKGNGGGKRGKG